MKSLTDTTIICNTVARIKIPVESRTAILVISISNRYFGNSYVSVEKFWENVISVEKFWENVITDTVI